MNYKTEIVIHILLFIAKMYAPEEWKEDLKQLTNHISVHGMPKEK